MNESKKTDPILHLTEYGSATELLDACRHVLMEHEITNGLMLGILEKNTSRQKDENEIYWTISYHEEILVMVMSGLYIILYATSTDPSLYRVAILELIEKDIPFPGIIGPKQIADTFRSVYEKTTGKTMKTKMKQRIYLSTSSTYDEMDDVSLVCATKKDIPVLLEWMEAFYLEVGEDVKPDLIEERLKDKLERKTLYLLRHNDTPVSMVGKERPFKDIVTVSYVFTPKPFRCLGYATVSVGIFTKMLLESYRIVTLYTDLANPTSNDIYRKIGYVPVTDSVVYLT
jgi:uncharacterized protein